MMGKKLVAVLFGLLVIGMAFGASGAYASGTQEETVEGITVILVSDNVADSAMAQYLANLTGAVLVTTPWGAYDPNVTAEILAYAPDQVVIIGGPHAVVDEYITDLEEYGITVYRWWGRNRYETNLAVINNATRVFKLRFNTTIVAPGNDSVAIDAALKLALKVRGAVAYANESTNATEVAKKFQARKVVMVRSRASERAMEKLAKGLENCNCTAEEVEANITEEHVVRVLERVQLRLIALEEMANLTNSTNLTERIGELYQLMEQANQSLRSGNYTEAYQLALKLHVLTEFAMGDAHLEFVNALKSNERLGLWLGLRRLEVQVRVLERAGINVTSVKETIEKAEEAAEAGDYSVARVLLNKARKALHELYVQNRGAIRMNMGMGPKSWKNPGSGKGRRP